MEPQSDLIKMTARLVLVTLIVFVMVIGKTFLVPFAWSLLIALASLKVLNWIKEKTRLPMGIIIPIYLIFILIALVSLGYFFYIELDRIFADMPSIGADVSDRLNNLSAKLAQRGIPLPDHFDKSFIGDWIAKHNDTFMGFISSFGSSLWNITLVLFYLFFLLYYRDLIPEFFVSHVKDLRSLAVMKARLIKSLSLIRSYIYGLLVLTIISSVLNYIIFLIFGIKFAVFFAVFLAVLNLIPYLGNLAGTAVIVLFTFITKDDSMIPVLVIICLVISNFIQDNIIRPLIIGDQLRMNAFTVFLSAILGGIIWGVSGMILFIPLVGVIKIIIESNKKYSNYAVFFSDIPKKSWSGKTETPGGTDVS